MTHSNLARSPCCNGHAKIGCWWVCVFSECVRSASTQTSLPTSTPIDVERNSKPIPSIESPASNPYIDPVEIESQPSIQVTASFDGTRISSPLPHIEPIPNLDLNFTNSIPRLRSHQVTATNNLHINQEIDSKAFDFQGLQGLSTDFHRPSLHDPIPAFDTDLQAPIPAAASPGFG